jgi:tetratricopeptide (TPR) repeat protein
MRVRATFPALLATVALLAGQSTAFAQGMGLLDASAVTVRDDHVDLTIDFSCSLRYQGHTPAGEGDTLRVQLAPGPECGLSPTAQFATERQLPADDAALVRSIELAPGLTGGAELVIQWNRVEKFVLAPSTGMRGLRIRVQRRPTTQVLVADTPQVPGSYAVNLESTREAIGEMAVAKAAALLRQPVFVSQVDVSGEHWNRLRAGPFDSRREAEQILRQALASYPTAWLGVEDESAAPPLPEGELLAASDSPAAVGASRAPETRTDQALDRLLDEARIAMTRKRFDDAAVRLTQIVAAEDYVHRVDAAELLGLARERKGQLAQAKAVYEDFLRRYPQAPAAGRIRQRLQTLRTAGLPGRRGSGGGAGREGWSGFGNLSQVYRRDNSQLSSTALSRNITTQNAVLTDVDGVIRRRGERLDFTARSNFGYAKDLIKFGRGDQTRVSSAYVELNDREWGLGARLGRQSRGMPGVPGAFDGLLGSWQWRSQVGFNAVVGMPVESTREGPNTDRKFVGVATDFATRDRSWDTAVYALTQQYAGAVDRRSIGFESRYMKPGRTLVAMADYDLHFHDANSAMLLGTLITPSRWTFNLDASWQRSPMLSIRNALIGQPTLVFDELGLTFTNDEIDQLAKDRTARLTQFSLTTAHAVGDRGQWNINLLSVNLSGTPGSGGVEAVPGLGRDNAVSTELLFNSLFKAGDTQSVALRYQTGGTGKLMSLGLGSRLPFGSVLRITTRMRVDRRTQELDSSRQWVYVPSLRLDYQRGFSALELEAGSELGRKDRLGSAENTTRYFFSLGYRLTLNRDRR